jgi:hypothetical protein
LIIAYNESGKVAISRQPIDRLIAKSFSGDQIKAVQTEIGSLVTVVIHMTVDWGSMTFSLLIPNVILPPSNVTNIFAEGVTTLQNFRSRHRWARPDRPRLH